MNSINSEQNCIIPIDRLMLQLDLNHMLSIIVGIKTNKGLQLYKINMTTYGMGCTNVIVTKMIDKFREGNGKKHYNKAEFREIFSQYKLIDMRVIEEYKKGKAV